MEREQRNPKIRRVEKMLAQPILRAKEDSGGLVVNFDPRLVMMLRENERLCKLDIAMPSVHQYLVKRKAWFLQFRDVVEQMLGTYQRTMSSLVPDLRKLYAPHLNKVKASLDPGLARIDWTCQSWEEFTDGCLAEVDIYKDLIDRANDIYYSRVEKLLESITSVELYQLPASEPWTMERFLDTVKTLAKAGSQDLQKKSTMIEDAIEDLICLAIEFKPSLSLVAKSEEATVDLREEEQPVQEKKGRRRMKKASAAALVAVGVKGGEEKKKTEEVKKPQGVSLNVSVQ